MKNLEKTKQRQLSLENRKSNNEKSFKVGFDLF